MFLHELREQHRTWDSLSPLSRMHLREKLKGLYGQSDERAAFNALTIDKQNALLLFAGRFLDLNLWDDVRRVENVYGLGGVGISFLSAATLRSALEVSNAFTSRFATHPDTIAGFFEKHARVAALHLLCTGPEESRWTAHFDLYNPVGSISGMVRHLIREKLLKKTPDWLDIEAAVIQQGRSLTEA